MFRKNLFIFTIGTIFTKILQYLLVPLLTFFLTTSDYGTIDLISTTINLLIPITTLSIIESVYRYGADKTKSENNVLLNGLVLWLVGTVLCIPLIFIGNFGINNLGLLLFCYFSFYSLFNILSYFVKSQNKSIIFTISNVLYGLLTSSMAILFVCGLKMGIFGYYLGFVLGNLISITFLIIAIRPIRRLITTKYDSQLMKEMLKYSIPLVLNNISWWIISATDKYLTLWSIGTDANGILAVVHKLPSVISVMSTIFLSAFQLSAFSEFDFTKDKKNESLFKYSKILNGLVFILVLCTAGICLIIRPFTMYFIEESYFESYLYIPIYALSTSLHCVSGFYGTLFSVKKENVPNTVSSIVGAVTNILFGYLFMFPLKMGLYGAALSTLISYIAVLLYRILKTGKFIKIEMLKQNYISLAIIVILVIFNSVSHALVLTLIMNAVLFILICLINIKQIKSLINFIFKKSN